MDNKGILNRFKELRSLTNPVVKDEQTLFVNRKADGLPEAKAAIDEGVYSRTACGWVALIFLFP